MSRRRVRKRRTIKIDKKVKVIISSVSLLLFIMFISVIFSILNMGNNKIAIGVKIANMNFSNLTQEEAIEKLKKWTDEVVLKDIEIQYKELDESINTEELGIDIDVEKIVREACKVGKTGNIIKDNYDILFCMIFNKNIEYNIFIDQEKIDKKIDELNSKLPEALEESNYYIEEDNLILTKGKEGTRIRRQEFEKLLYGILEKQNDRNINIPIDKVMPQEINIEEIYKEIYREAENAYITTNPTKINPEVKGVDFAISMEEVKNILKEEKEEYIIPLKITIPEITIADLGKEAFPDILGTFSTTYSTTNANRVTNLELASEKINGTVILPGETFSYNKIVGERTIAKGYKEAAVYSGGKVVDGIGGGICQLSSTLYNAVVYANLEVTSRNNHRFLTSYVEAGRDATVSWGTIDFCFKNTRSYPIKIVSIVKNGVVTTDIYGMREEKEYEVVIENKVIEVIQYKTNYIKDNTLNEGTEEIKQYGANGAKSQTYKIVKYNGNIISKTLLSSDTYSPLERIIRKGTKKVEGVSAQTFEENINGEKINPELLNTIVEL